MKHLGRAGMGAVAVICAGCGSVDGGGAVDDVAGEGDIGVEQAEIGEASCANAVANVVVSGDPFVTSPTTYNHPSCFKAYVVRVNNYVAAADPSTWKYFFARWNGNITTQAACEAAWVRMDLYRLVGGAWQFYKTEQGDGTWWGGTTGCSEPIVPLLPEFNGSYKVTLSARTSNSPSAPTRSVILETGAPH